MVASAERQSFSRERDELVLPIRDAGHVVLERDAGLDDLGRGDARQRRASGRDTPSTRFARPRCARAAPKATAAATTAPATNQLRPVPPSGMRHRPPRQPECPVAPGEEPGPPRAAAGRRLPESELARALRPRVPTLLGEDALGHDDLLPSRGEVGARCERAAAESVPRRRQELEPSVEPIAGIDRPVPTALALREAIPHAGPETAVPAATEDGDHGDEHRRGHAAPDPGLDLHDALPRRGLTRSPPSGKATRHERERRRPEAGGEVTRRLGVDPASGKGFARL